MKYFSKILRSWYLVSVIVVCVLLTEPVFCIPVSGIVFLDLNHDGVKGAREPGLSNVAVSDGHKIILTTGKGYYNLETKVGQYVFISLPQGYRTSKKFFAQVEEACEINFPLEDWEESKKKVFQFAQISDIHIDVREDMKKVITSFNEDILELNGIYPLPAFIIATGDMIIAGKEKLEFDNYLRCIANLKIPIFHLPGNHDVEHAGAMYYQDLLGPKYYSFNFGNYHFVLLNSNDFDQKQKDWLRNDLAVLPEGMSIIFALHHLPSHEKLRFLSSYKAKAILSGHWHGNRVCNNYGMLDINTPPLRFGGLDRHPRGFRLINIRSDNTMDCELRLGGFIHYTEVVSPQTNIKPINGKLSVIVNAYDTRYEIAEISCNILGSFLKLQRVSTWTWRGEFKLPDQAEGEQKINVMVKSSNGETWNIVKTFTILDEPINPNKISVPLSLKWVASTGGVIGFSSPKIGRKYVAIGVDDKGDLTQCGVSLFTKSGEFVWHYNTESAVKNNIAISKGRIFATSVSGWLYALNESTGKLLWKASIGAENDQRWEIASTTVDKGIVYTGAQSCIAAFDARNGKLIWKMRNYKNDWKPTSYSIPVVVHNKFVVTTRTNVYVLDAQTGQSLWKLNGKFNGCLVLKNIVYTTKDGFLTALELNTGKTLWTGNESIGSTVSSPSIFRDKLVIGTENGRVCAFSVYDGALLWTAQTNATLSSTNPYQRGGKEINSSPLIYEGKVYIGAGDGEIHVFSLLDGKKIGGYKLGIPILSSPIIDDDTLYIGGYDGNLYAFEQFCR